MKTKNTPSHTIFQVIEREKNANIWTRVGAAWIHQDGKGFNLAFSAIPMHGRVVLRRYDPDAANSNADEKGA